MQHRLKLPEKLRKLKAPLAKAPRKVREFCGTKRLRITDCSRTITGTHKDFRSASLLEQFGSMNPVFYSITMGNAGFSLGTLARIYNKATGRNVRVVNVIDERLKENRRRVLEQISILIATDLRSRILTQRELLDLIQVNTNERGLFVHAEIGYFTHRKLVMGVLRANVDYIILPIGGGELLDSFLKGIAMCKAAGLKVPKIIGITIKQNIFANSEEAKDPNGFSIADKLVSPTSIFLDQINGSAKDFDLDIVVVSDPEILEAVAVLEQTGIKSEPSAAAAFAGLRKAREENKLDESAKVIVVNTGYGLV